MASNLKPDLKIWSEGQVGVSQVTKGRVQKKACRKVHGPLGESKNYSIAQGEGHSEGMLKGDSQQVARVR